MTADVSQIDTHELTLFDQGHEYTAAMSVYFILIVRRGQVE